MTETPIAENLFVQTPEPRLVGARRRADGKIVFPAPTGVESQQYERVSLSPRGTLWSYTVQRFRPKSPPYAGDDDDRSFRPFALGYVELPGEVIVETRIETEDFDSLRIGQPMELVLVPFRRAEGRGEALTYAFKPSL